MDARETRLGARDETRGSEAGEAPALQIGLLYEQHRRMVGALCRLLLRDPVEAEDAVQQTFLSAFGSLSAGTVPRQPAAWLAAIARRECWARTAQRRRLPLPLEEAAESAMGGDPVEEAIRSVDFAALWSAIDRLPHSQRKAFLMREFSGLSYAEVAVALGVTESAIESLLVRARRHLRDGLATTVSAANAALTPLVLLHHRLWRLFGGSPSARTGAAAAVGLPAAVKVTTTTAVVVAIASVGAGLRATMFAGHHPTRTPLAAPQEDIPLAAPDRTAGSRGPAAPHRRLAPRTRAATVRAIFPTTTRKAHSSPERHDRTPGRVPVPATATVLAAPPAKPKARAPSDTPTVPATTVEVPVQTDTTPSASTPSDTNPADAPQTDGARTDTTTTDGQATDTAPTDTVPSDTTSTDAASTDTSSGS